MSELERNPAILTRAGAFFYGVLFVVALIVSKLAEQMGRWWDPSGPAIFLQISAGLAAGLTAVWLSRMAERYIPGVQALASDFSDMLRGLSRFQAWTLAFFSGVAEEALFRGTLQPLVGIVPATCLFALIHIGPAKRYLWWTFSALIYGIGLALLFEWGQSLIAPIIAHFVINAINLYRLATRPALPLRPGAV